MAAPQVKSAGHYFQQGRRSVDGAYLFEKLACRCATHRQSALSSSLLFYFIFSSFLDMSALLERLSCMRKKCREHPEKLVARGDQLGWGEVFVT